MSSTSWSLKSTWRPYPALLTSRSTRPARSTILPTSASTLARSDTSQTWTVASPPARRISVATSSRRSARRANSATRMPCAARSWASCAPMPLEAPVTMPTVSRKSARRTTGSGRGTAVARRQGAEGEPDEVRNERRSQQAGVVASEPALVLVDAGLGERPERHLADRLRYLHREVVARVRGAEVQRRPHAAEGLEREPEAASHEEPRSAFERQAEPAVCYPVGEEEDVPRFFVHDAVERAYEGVREESRVGREPEEPEREERVEALAVSHPEERPLRVARRGRPAVADGDAVTLRQALEQRRVPLLLVRLHRDRLAQQGVGLDVRHRAHARCRRRLALHRLVPERHRAEPLDVRFVEVGPADVAHLVTMMGVYKVPAEERLVLFGADCQLRHPFLDARRVRAIYRSPGARARPHSAPPLGQVKLTTYGGEASALPSRRFGLPRARTRTRELTSGTLA